MSHAIVHSHGPRPEHVAAAYRRACEMQMERAMIQVEGQVRFRAPFRTGHLRRSITHAVRTVGSHLVGMVGTNLTYARYLEQGTGLYGPRNRRIVPTRASALRWPAGGAAGSFQGGRRTQGSAGPGFRLTGAPSASGGGGYVFRRSVRGIHPLRFMADAVQISHGRVERELAQVPAVMRQLLEGRA